MAGVQNETNLISSRIFFGSALMSRYGDGGTMYRFEEIVGIFFGATVVVNACKFVSAYWISAKPKNLLGFAKFICKAPNIFSKASIFDSCLLTITEWF